MRRPSVLFHYPVLNAGGAEMSVIRLTSLLAAEGWHVELVLTTGGGVLESRVDPRVKVRCLRGRSAGGRFLAARTATETLASLGDAFVYALTRVQGAVRSLAFSFKRYDAAVIALHGLSPAFCCNTVKADRRLHWIRNDLRHCDGAGDARGNIAKYCRRVDTYVCVSEGVHESFCALWPELTHKAVVLHNVLNAQSLRDAAEGAPSPYLKFGAALKVVTVCRLAERAKGLLRMVDVHKRLLREGLDFFWFVVGDGPDREALEGYVRQSGLASRFILVGHQANPLPFYRHADIAATLSNYEGLCGAINEAKIMGRPVLATNFAGVREQIIDGENGLIVEQTEKAICDGLRRLLTDKPLRERLTNDHLPEQVVNDRAKIERLTELLLGTAKA